MRKLIGRMLEWFLHYEHEIVFEADEMAFGVPFRKHSGDAGYDLYCSKITYIEAGSAELVPSGIYVDPKSQIWFEMKARSSTMAKKGLAVTDAVIDRDYRGELFSIVHNPGTRRVAIERGERVVQMVPHPLINCKFTLGKVRPSERGVNGFGSSGN